MLFRSTHKQLEERGRYQSSLAGVLASANPYADNTEFVLKQTGKWNSKTTEDYLAMCNQKIWKDKNIVKDLALLAGEWRNAVVKEIGRSKYDALSKARRQRYSLHHTFLRQNYKCLSPIAQSQAYA